MKSYSCEFELKDVLRLMGGPLVPVALFAVLMHAGAHFRWLPAPRPTLDTDRTLLIHQADASKASHDAEVLLIGDSSCLMDVSAPLLAKELGRPVFNLGTLSYLDPAAYAILLRRFVEANPNRLRAVVLLMHPEALRRIGAESYHLGVLTNYLGGRDHFRTETLEGKIAAILGLDIFKGRVIARALPSPLGGNYAHFYGFTRDLEHHLFVNRGSALDPGSARLQGSSEYRLSPGLEKAAREFKAAVPAGVTLLVGLTPVPGQFAGPRLPETQRELLRQWAEWLGADGLLDDLPAVLPDEQFAGTTHLKPAAVTAYTEDLGRSLNPRLQ